MADDALTLLLARIEALLAALYRRLAVELQRAMTAAAPADQPLPAAAVPALLLVIDREVGRIVGHDPGAAIDRDGRPLAPLAILLLAARGAGVGLVERAGVMPAGVRSPATVTGLARRVVAAGDETRRQLRERLAYHVAAGTPIDDAAADIAGLLRPTTTVAPGRPGGTDALYTARRLVANETRTAHATAVATAARASDGRYLVRYTVSAAHVDEDACTRYSRANNGWGPGVFDPTKPLPPIPAHPNCRCRWVLTRAERA